MEIKGKTAIITGGGHRVGKAITLGLAYKGANVVVNYHTSSDAALETTKQAKGLGAGALAIQCDVSDSIQVRKMVSATVEKYGGVDILINSASWFQKTPFPMDEFDQWHRVFDTLIHGAMYCSNYVAPLMMKQGEGAIINILDSFAWRPIRGFSAHSAGKAALLSFTRQLALELAPEIRVNAVSPGPVLPPPEYSEEQNKRIAGRTLLKRWGKPDDVLDAILFLIQANYITGEVITVDGGERYG